MGATINLSDVFRHREYCDCYSRSRVGISHTSPFLDSQLEQCQFEYAYNQRAKIFKYLHRFPIQQQRHTGFYP